MIDINKLDEILCITQLELLALRFPSKKGHLPKLSFTGLEEGEVSRPIPETLGEIEITSFGRVIVNGKWIKRPVTNNGRKEIHYNANGVGYKDTLSRLVLRVFNPPPNNEIKNLRVIHLDGNTTNSNLSNLKWGTAGDIMLQSIAQNKLKEPRPFRTKYIKPNGKIGYRASKFSLNTVNACINMIQAGIAAYKIRELLKISHTAFTQIKKKNFEKS